MDNLVTPGFTKGRKRPNIARGLGNAVIDGWISLKLFIFRSQKWKRRNSPTQSLFFLIIFGDTHSSRHWPLSGFFATRHLPHALSLFFAEQPENSITKMRMTYFYFSVSDRHTVKKVRILPTAVELITFNYYYGIPLSYRTLMGVWPCGKHSANC